MLFAAGMVAGESLTGVILAIPIVVSGRADVLALPPALRLAESGATWLGLILFTAMALLLYRVRAAASRGVALNQRAADGFAGAPGHPQARPVFRA